MSKPQGCVQALGSNEGNGQVEGGKGPLPSPEK